MTLWQSLHYTRRKIFSKDWTRVFPFHLFSHKLFKCMEEGLSYSRASFFLSAVRFCLVGSFSGQLFTFSSWSFRYISNEKYADGKQTIHFSAFNIFLYFPLIHLHFVRNTHFSHFLPSFVLQKTANSAAKLSIPTICSFCSFSDFAFFVFFMFFFHLMYKMLKRNNRK